jgi:hypothetical protein
MSDTASVSNASDISNGAATGQVPELPREEILKQIFGDIGELIDGKCQQT